MVSNPIYIVNLVAIKNYITEFKSSNENMQNAKPVTKYASILFNSY